MKNKILSLILAICLIMPFGIVLSACNKTENPPTTPPAEEPPAHSCVWETEWSNNAQGHWYACEDQTCLEQKDFASHDGVTCSVCGYQYFSPEQVVNQIDTLATDILVYLCGYYGMGLSVSEAELYGIELTEDIAPEGQSFYAMLDISNSCANAWAWTPIQDTDVLALMDTSGEYIEAYINEYPAEEKENYKDKLVASLYNILIEETPADLEEETLLELAENFDHLGFTQDEKTAIVNFIFSDIIGTSVYEYDISFNNYYGYATIIPQMIETILSRTYLGDAVYPNILIP